jgi:hypothetical protein
MNKFVVFVRPLFPICIGLKQSAVGKQQGLGAIGRNYSKHILGLIDLDLPFLACANREEIS